MNAYKVSIFLENFELSYFPIKFQSLIYLLSWRGKERLLYQIYLLKQSIYFSSMILIAFDIFTYKLIRFCSYIIWRLERILIKPLNKLFPLGKFLEDSEEHKMFLLAFTWSFVVDWGSHSLLTIFSNTYFKVFWSWT